MGTEAASCSRLTVYGSFTCPWSYLASRRVDSLVRDGVQVSWRAVEQPSWGEARATGPGVCSHRARSQLDQVLTELLPGERLPHAWSGHVPGTRAAVLAYADADLHGVGDLVRPRLFSAFWEHAIDLDETDVVNSLVADAWRDRPREADEPRTGRHGAGRSRQSDRSAARRSQRWRDELSRFNSSVLPVVVVGERSQLHGGHAVGWLGEQMPRGRAPSRVEPWPWRPSGARTTAPARYQGAHAGHPLSQSPEARPSPRSTPTCRTRLQARF